MLNVSLFFSRSVKVFTINISFLKNNLPLMGFSTDGVETKRLPHIFQRIFCSGSSKTDQESFVCRLTGAYICVSLFAGV